MPKASSTLLPNSSARPPHARQKLGVGWDDQCQNRQRSLASTTEMQYRVVMAYEARPAVDGVLDEVEYHIKRLDQCVARIAEQMERTEDCDGLARLAGDALDANKNATALQELRMLLMEQKRSEGGGSTVPQSVLDILNAAHESCERYVGLYINH